MDCITLIGFIILYFAARYLIRNLSAYLTQLVEEEALSQNLNQPTKRQFDYSINLKYMLNIYFINTFIKT
jgi:hypothetical protein